MPSRKIKIKQKRESANKQAVETRRGCGSGFFYGHTATPPRRDLDEMRRCTLHCVMRMQHRRRAGASVRLATGLVFLYSAAARESFFYRSYNARAGDRRVWVITRRRPFLIFKRLRDVEKSFFAQAGRLFSAAREERFFIVFPVASARGLPGCR